MSIASDETFFPWQFREWNKQVGFKPLNVSVVPPQKQASCVDVC